MMNTLTANNKPSTIIKVIQCEHINIQSHSLTRHALGYVVRGRKYIYSGDSRQEVLKGNLFYLNIGSHYIEDVPDVEQRCEQIIFFYSSADLSDIMAKLSYSYHMPLTNNLTSCNSANINHVVCAAWPTIKNFFGTVNQYLKDGIFVHDQTAEALKKTELIYLIMSHEGCNMRSIIMNHIDLSMEKFKYVVQRNIFNNKPIGELASECNRSLTSFKKEFRRIFHQPPHMWIINQRIIRSRLLLISTNKSISEISTECGFTSASHFIKLFKKEYGTTPAEYRNNCVLGRAREMKSNSSDDGSPTENQHRPDNSANQT